MLLAAYVVVALVHGIAAGVPFTSLLSSDSFWRGARLLLQGAVVAGLIVLPAAPIAAAIRVGTRHPGRGSASHALYQAIALATSVAIVGAALPLSSDASVGSAAQASRAVDDTARRLGILDNSLRAIEDGTSTSPRDRWDPAYIVEQIGTDPDALFAWVRDNTFWIPYRGALRGPIGVLMDRQGNSLDRALTLATLLAAAGHTVRVARGEISRTQALDLLPDLVARHSVRLAVPPGEDAQPAPDLKATAAQYQFNGDAIERAVVEQDDGLDTLDSALQDRVGDQAGRLLSVVARPDADAEWLARYQGALDALRDHWWVQRENRGAWSDLDVLAPAGTTSLSVPVQGTPALDALPAELHHEVTVRVVAEQRSGGRLAESPVLEHVLRPSGVLGQPVVLQFWPGSWPRELHPDPSSPLGLKGAALEQREWTAALFVGGDLAAQGVLRADGISDLVAPGNPFGGLGGGIAALPPRPRPSNARAQELTAAWIEYEIRAPGHLNRIVRRAVFDLLGAVQRSSGALPQPALAEAQRLTRSLSLMMRTDILALSAEPAPEFIAQLASKSLVGNRDLLRAVVRDAVNPGESATEELLAGAAPVVTPIYSLALARSEWSPVRDLVVMDRAGIFTRHRYPAFAGPDLVLREATDIVANEVGVSLVERDAFAVRLIQGVLDTNAEAIMLATRRSGNTGDAFSASADWVTLTPAQGDRARGLDLPADAQRAIAHDLERGYLVVAPQTPVETGSERYVGWWRIDAATGDTLGVAANGWGQAMAERGVQYNVVVEMAKTFAFEYAFCQAVPQVMNQAVIFLQPYRNELPPWLPPLAQAKDAGTLYRENKKGCLIGAMIGTGITATLPLLLLALRFTAARAAGPLARLWRDQRGGIRIPPGLVRGQVRGGPPITEPLPGQNPGGGPQRKGNPFAKTEPDPLRTQLDKGAAPGQPSSGTGPAPASAGAAQQQAAAAEAAAAQERFQATQDYVRYRANKPNPARGHEGDPSKWDPRVDEALQNEMMQKAQQHNEALNRLNEAQSAAQSAARDAAAAARRAQGKGGFPPPQPKPSPKLPGCPPNCGNNNPTGPAGDVQVLVGVGGLSRGGS